MIRDTYQSPPRVGLGQVVEATPAIPEAFSCQEKELMQLRECVNILESKLHTVMRIEPTNSQDKKCEKDAPAQSVAERIREATKTISTQCSRLSEMVRLLEL